MTAATRRGIFVVAGYGNGSGQCIFVIREFAKAGYKVALIARGVAGADALQKGADEIIKAGGEAAPFPIASYDSSAIHSAFEGIKKRWPNEPIQVTLYNAAFGVWKPFLSVSEDDWKQSVEINVLAAVAFAKESILAFKENELNAEGKRGTLLFTGATASIRGNKTTSSFSSGKFALRSLSQSLNKEFGKENIHVAHSVIDGGILTDRRRERDPVAYEKIKDDLDTLLRPESIAKSYVYLAHQDRSAWTWEIDLRPAHETW
ncbi:NAD(P)-binding protein [Sistotremastrum suecicum HHB10207 ss-3]|uniref:NAD(P)-binding protein n=1 Tax=Sistotremastrum suecicum HHB10207 ss-3 TaxID=1314776 RepID=A0A166H3J1_9AGAM|nr:NAD(P)-binding protein [Sistotremastrum suecicum HHB10207 ss-3]